MGLTVLCRPTPPPPFRLAPGACCADPASKHESSSSASDLANDQGGLQRSGGAAGLGTAVPHPLSLRLPLWGSRSSPEARGGSPAQPAASLSGRDGVALISPGPGSHSNLRAWLLCLLHLSSLLLFYKKKKKEKRNPNK